MYLLIIILALVLLYVALKPYLMRFDTVVAFTGGLGTGKSYISTLTAVRLLKKARFKTRLYNLLHPFDKLDLPLLYSSIGIGKVNAYVFADWKEELLSSRGLFQNCLYNCIVNPPLISNKDTNTRQNAVITSEFAVYIVKIGIPFDGID